MSEMIERADSLRRAVRYGLDNGKTNMIAELDILDALLSGNVPVGNNVLPPEEVTRLLYELKGTDLLEA